MILSSVQRLSAVIFLVAFLVHTHAVGPSTAAPIWKTIALLTLASGIVHAASSVYVVATDFWASPRARRTFAAVLSASALLGATIGAAAVVGSSSQPAIAGHLPGSRCATCHEAERHSRLDLMRLDAHGERSCETCHDVRSRTDGLLAFERLERESAAASVQDPPRFQAQPQIQAGRRAPDLCLHCHTRSRPSALAEGTVHAGLPCSSCHSARADQDSWRAARTCKRCHPLANDVHQDVGALPTTFADGPHDIHFLRCDTCHDARASAKPPPP